MIPRKKDGQEGFDVLNPLYCYDGGKISFRQMAEGTQKPIIVDRSAVIVNRGWIPYELKDKRSRPWEIGTRELTKVVGTWRKSKSVYDYKVPNNPNDNEWHNLCVEDIAAFWELPNANEFKFFYFQAVNITGEAADQSELEATFPLKMTVDELYQNEYRPWTSENTNMALKWGFGTIAAASFAAGVIF